MKKTLIFVMLLLFASVCFAADFSATLSIKSGDKDIDLALKEINERAKTNPAQVREDLKTKLSLDQREIDFLAKQGYTLAEIDYLASLAKASGKTPTDVAALHSKGVGWGVLAMRLGVRPDALRKLIVAQKKVKREEIKETKKSIKMEGKKEMMREKERKEIAPAQMMKETPATRKGMGR